MEILNWYFQTEKINWENIIRYSDPQFIENKVLKVLPGDFHIFQGLELLENVAYIFLDEVNLVEF